MKRRVGAGWTDYLNPLSYASSYLKRNRTLSRAVGNAKLGPIGDLLAGQLYSSGYGKRRRKRVSRRRR